MKLTERQAELNTEDKTKLETEKKKRPELVDFPTAVELMNAGNHPNCFYDHVHDMVYVRILDKEGNPTGNYRHAEAIDPDPTKRKFKTVED